METPVEKIKKGNIISYQHKDSDETLYFAIVRSNTRKVLKLQLLNASNFNKIIKLDSKEKNVIRINLCTINNKQSYKKLLSEHAEHGIKAYKEMVKSHRKLQKEKKSEVLKKTIKEYKIQLRYYKELNIFYPHMINTLLPE